MRFLVLTILLALAACGGSQQKVTKVSKVPTVDALEVAFHYMFYSDLSAAQHETGYYFIAIESSDPPQGLVSRFIGQEPKVAPKSVAIQDCSESASWTRSLVHRFNSESGTLFEITRIKRVSDTSYEIEWQFNEWCQDSPRYTFYLTQAKGRWKVVSREKALSRTVVEKN